MIARQHDPRPGERLQRAEQAADHRVRDGLQVEYVAGDQHGVDLARRRFLSDPAHGLEARFREMRGFVRLELAELRAYLPVRGVQKPDHCASIPFNCIVTQCSSGARSSHSSGQRLAV